MSSRRRLSFSGSLCELCGKAHSHFSSPQDWKDEEAQKYMYSLDVKSNAKVCRPCRGNVARVLGNVGYVPRWEKVKISNTYSCCILNCSNSSIAATSTASLEELRNIFESKGLTCNTIQIPVPTPLCKPHYHMVYDALKTR